MKDSTALNTRETITPSLKERLSLLTIGESDVLTEKLGDEILWVVKNCAMADVVNLFEDPVGWVKNLPGGGFTLSPDFVVHFKMVPGAESSAPTYLVSGIDQTGVISIRISGSLGSIPSNVSRRRTSLSRQIQARSAEERAHRAAVTEQILTLWDGLHNQLITSNPDVHIVVSTADGLGFGHAEIITDINDPDRQTYVAGFLTGCATDPSWLNNSLCSQTANTYATVNGATTALPNAYRFGAVDATSLEGITFLYQATDADTQPVCEYGTGTVSGTAIGLETSITKDY